MSPRRTGHFRRGLCKSAADGWSEHPPDGSPMVSPGTAETGRPSIVDLLTVVERLPERPNGKRARVDRVQGRDQLYRELVRLAIKTGAGMRPFHTSWLQLAAALGYELSGNRKADHQRYHKTIRRRMDDLAAGGLVAYGPVKDGNGRFRCLWVQVLPGNVNNAETRAEVDIRHGRGHAGTWKRRHSGRHAPPTRVRGGRAGPIERPLFFGRSEMPSPVEPADPRPYGAGGSAWDGHGCAREAAPPGEGSGERVSRLRGAWQTFLGCDPSDWQGMEDIELLAGLHDRLAHGDLSAADELFSIVFDRSPCPARGGRRAQLDRALLRCDRHAPGGRAERGAGAAQLIRLMLRPVDVAPASVAFYAPPLDRLSKSWRRDQRAAAKQEAA
jgi:hypothetical protein